MRYVAPIIATPLPLSACLSKPPTQPFACSVGVSWSADPDFKPNEKRTIEAGLQIWSSGTDGRVCFYEGGDQVRFFRVERQAELCPFDSVADGKLPKSDYAAFCALHGCQK